MFEFPPDSYFKFSDLYCFNSMTNLFENNSQFVALLMDFSQLPIAVKVEDNKIFLLVSTQETK